MWEGRPEAALADGRELGAGDELLGVFDCVE